MLAAGKEDAICGWWNRKFEFRITFPVVMAYFADCIFVKIYESVPTSGEGQRYGKAMKSLDLGTF